MKTLLLSLALFISYSSSISAKESKWYYIWYTCAHCDANGQEVYLEANERKAKQRLFISTPVNAGAYDHDCKEGAFFRQLRVNGSESFGYESQAKVKRAIGDMVSDRRADGYKIHLIKLEKHCS